jgi:hypothetical protein
MIRRLLLLSFGCTLLASADEVTFSLSTSGTFSSGTPSDLRFDGIGTTSTAGFTGTTVGGSLSWSNLGTFTVRKPEGGADNYGGTFTLNLFFFDPVGIITPTGFTAPLTGTVNNQQGSVVIDFGPTQTFHFSNSDASGGFDLSISDLTLTIPHDRNTTSVSQVLTGSITNAYDPPIDTAPVPEPGSIVLLGGVTLLVVGKIRRLQRQS